MIKQLIVAALAATTAGPVMAQANFPDVAPTNWAYQAILNLRDKYGCAKGFPDGTFRAGQPATRAELAALTNACLDEITSYVDSKDAALAAALRAEIGKVGNRVTKLEVAAQVKDLRVGPYVGAGVSITNRPELDSNFNNNNKTVVGGSILGRLPLFTSGKLDAISLRPFVGFASENTFVRTVGGVTVTYDKSVSRATLLDGSQVSKANIYAGLGGIWTNRGGFGDNNTNGFGNSGTGVGVIGYEARLSPSLVGFVDVKLPFQSVRDLRNGDSTYSPIGTLGLGWKF